MIGFSAKTRIAFGLVCISTSLLTVAMMLGVLPDKTRMQRTARERLCETIAVQSSYLLMNGDPQQLRQSMAIVASRNPDITSVGLRGKHGRLLFEVGDHESQWILDSKSESTDEQVQVPLFANGSRWGNLELRFHSITEPGIIGLMGSAPTQTLLFLSCGTFVLYFFYLQRVLSQLDPSQAVPQHVRSALDTLREGLIVLDASQRVVLANQAFASLMGKNPEKLVGQSVSELPWVNHDANDRLPWELAMESRAVVELQMMQLRVDDGIKTFLVNCSPVLGQDGQYRGVLVSLEDITLLEQKKAELVKSQEAAEAANQAKSDFLANMSHEIRTPMNAILGFTDVLRRGIGTPTEREKYLATIHSSGKHLLELINDILDISKIEAGRLEVELRQCSVVELIGELSAMFQMRAEEKGLVLKLSAETKIPEFVETDAARLRQAITNLVGNAIKFTDQGGVQISLRCDVRNGQRKLSIAVTDSGIGMSPVALQRIFDPFVQADASITRRYGGTGLGLSISRRLARALGGDLTVESIEGAGSTFTLTFDPGALTGVEWVDPLAVWSQARSQAMQAQPVPTLPATRILVADDGVENRELIRLVLTEAGAQVTCATNGQEAVVALSRATYDAVLLDMQMPVMDGYTAAGLMRAQGYKGPIFALTAAAMAGDEKRCRDAGCSGFLSKPVDIDRLLQSLCVALGIQATVAKSGVNPTGSPSPSANASEPLISTLPTNKPQFADLVRRFAGRLTEQIEAMEAALSTGNEVRLAELAHWLKGSGGNVGFMAFTQPAAEMEFAAKCRDFEGVAAQMTIIRNLQERMVVPDDVVLSR